MQTGSLLMQSGSLWECIGNTPLIYIKSLSEYTGCHIYGKAEFLNPGGSVKDRAAKSIIAQAEMQNRLKSGSTIVEGTAGNTGIGLAMLAAERGYKCIITIPDNQSIEKYQILEVLGAEIHKVPVVPFSNSNHFYHQAKKIAEENNYFWANQFENLANSQAHYQYTGPEIWQQTQGKVDVFISSCGTGGTMGGVSQFLKEKKAQIEILLADPMGSGLFSYIKTGKFEASGSSVTEGIGIMRLTENFKKAKIDDALQISDKEMFDMLYSLAKNNGLFVGTSSALNVSACLQYALKNKNSGKTIVTILNDSGARYLSKIGSRKES